MEASVRTGQEKMTENELWKPTKEVEAAIRRGDEAVKRNSAYIQAEIASYEQRTGAAATSGTGGAVPSKEVNWHSRKAVAKHYAKTKRIVQRLEQRER